MVNWPGRFRVWGDEMNQVQLAIKTAAALGLSAHKVVKSADRILRLCGSEVLFIDNITSLAAVDRLVKKKKQRVATAFAALSAAGDAGMDLIILLAALTDAMDSNWTGPQEAEAINKIELAIQVMNQAVTVLNKAIKGLKCYMTW